ncbi:hypothetical protein G5B39_18575 (plasmid) [Rhodobacteraceae bacterium SC52]|nr:hypothetical protein G5B39_18575 [Rhodobacteraceae bacterium SC52]
MKLDKKAKDSRVKYIGRQDRRSLEDVLHSERWNEFCEADIAALISEGCFSLPGFRALDRFLEALDARNLTIDHIESSVLEAVLREMGSPSVTNLTALLKALSNLFEPPALTLELQKMISEMKKSYRLKKQGPDGRTQRKRKFSVPESALPGSWQAALADMRLGTPGHAASAPAPSVTDTLCRKVSELAKVTQELDLQMVLTKETAVAYERSLLNRERPLAADTIHSSLVHIHHFSKYLGLDKDLVAYLAGRVRLHASRCQTMTPVKQRKAGLIPSYGEILTLAVRMLEEATHQTNPKFSQKQRNHAAAIALFCPFPLRVADSRLCFGETLFWTGDAYRIHIPATSKNDQIFRATLHPFFGQFVDALILRGVSPDYLEQLREQCLEDRRLLFINSNGTAPHANYVSYAWKMVFGTGSHIARTKIHDELARLGPEGVELALKACTHSSPRTADYYRSKMFDSSAEEYVHKTLEDGITEDEWDRYFGQTSTGSGTKTGQVQP